MERGCVVELCAVAVGGLAWLCALAATLRSAWLQRSAELLPSESFSLGLWGACVEQEGGALACSPHPGLLALPPPVAMARVLMCVALTTGLLALLLAVPGLRSINSCRHKRALRLGGAGLSLVAALLELLGVSLVARLAVQSFFDPAVPDVLPRWEFGDALFTGWTAAILHLAAAALLCTSCLCLQGPLCSPASPIPLSHLDRTPHRTRTRTEYV